jgi:hypothetical protein
MMSYYCSCYYDPPEFISETDVKAARRGKEMPR